MTNLKNTFRNLFRYPSAVLGFIIIAFIKNHFLFFNAAFHFLYRKITFLTSIDLTKINP